MMKLSKLGSWTLAIGVLALAGTPAMAQGPRGGGFGFGFGGAGLLMVPAVQKELKLSDEQTGKVGDVVRSVRQKHQDEFAGLRDLPENERGAKMRELSKTVTDEVKKELALSQEQSKRLDQIELQQRGLQAFLDPKIQDKLNITDDQKSKFREIATAAREKTQALRGNDGGDRTEAFRKMAEIRRESNEKALTVLTDDQKKTWKELTGDPVEIRFQPRRNNNNN